MKSNITVLFLAILLFASSACRSMGALNGQSEPAHLFRVAFLTPESSQGPDEDLVTELEALLIEHANPASLTSTQTQDKIEVRMRFEDEQSCEDAGSPTAFAISLFSAAHPNLQYDDPSPCCPKQ